MTRILNCTVIDPSAGTVQVSNALDDMRLLAIDGATILIGGTGRTPAQLRSEAAAMTAIANAATELAHWAEDRASDIEAAATRRCEFDAAAIPAGRSDGFCSDSCARAWMRDERSHAIAYDHAADGLADAS